MRQRRRGNKKERSLVHIGREGGEDIPVPLIGMP